MQLDRGARTFARCAAIITMLLSLLHSSAAAADRYWEWGWGLYGLHDQRNPLDNARFDWTYVLFGGSDAPDERTAAHANAVLALHPGHRFVLRIWPILGLGDCPENNRQATLFHYLYQPGVRAKVLTETKRQLQFFLSRIDDPQSVVGATFLEELPFHFTSAPFSPEWRTWKPGDRLPWDLARFEREITREAGPIDLRSARFRRWWGRKYAQVLGEIHREMKKQLGSRPVIYYRHSLVASLDEAESSARALSDAALMPIHYRDVIGSGRADGLFIYPSHRGSYERQRALLHTLRGLTFSQISLPSGMRSSSIAEMTSLARTAFPQNLGAFLFATAGAPSREAAYEDLDNLTQIDLIRRFAWDNEIHRQLVDSVLRPRLRVSVTDDGQGRATVFAQLWNSRELSWYGGSYEDASLHEAHITPRLPSGWSVIGEAERVVQRVGPQDGVVLRWPVRTDGRPGVASATLQVGGVRVESDDPSVPAQSEPVRVTRSGSRWLQAPVDGPFAMEVAPNGDDVDSPMLARPGRARVYYRGVLRASSRLVVMDDRARLLPASLFDEPTRRFEPLAHAPDGALHITSGGLFFTAFGPTVHSDETYHMSLDGDSDGSAAVDVTVTFVGVRDGQPASLQRVLPGFARDARADANELTVPPFDGGIARIVVHFYRGSGTGTVRCRSFTLRRSDLPARGLDVSDRLVGALPALDAVPSLWGYFDRSHGRDGSPAEIIVRVLPSAEIHSVFGGGRR